MFVYLNADSRKVFLFLQREYSRITKTLKIMVEIDFKDLCVFEQLLKEKCERLSKGLKMLEKSPNTRLCESFRSDLFFYSSLYDDIVDKFLKIGFKK